MFGADGVMDRGAGCIAGIISSVKQCVDGTSRWLHKASVRRAANFGERKKKNKRQTRRERERERESE